MNDCRNPVKAPRPEVVRAAVGSDSIGSSWAEREATRLCHQAGPLPALPEVWTPCQGSSELSSPFDMTLPSPQDIAEQRRKLLPSIIQPDRSLHFLRPGRLVRIKEGPNDWGWGIVLAVRQLPAAVKKVQSPKQPPCLRPAYVKDQHSIA